MSERYDEYIKEHKNNVLKAFKWLKENDILNNFENYILERAEYNITYKHDFSKTEIDEYDAYDKYFYGNNKSFAVVQDFNYAWLYHIHRNPHHWQYWILINDDPNEGEKILDMPDEYIIEMICDWWSFSWKQNNLNEIFKWYDERKDYIKLSKETRTKVENIFSNIKNKLEENK